jgi:hypothetical protein
MERLIISLPWDSNWFFAASKSSNILALALPYLSEKFIIITSVRPWGFAPQPHKPLKRLDLNFIYGKLRFPWGVWYYIFFRKRKENNDVLE